MNKQIVVIKCAYDFKTDIDKIAYTVVLNYNPNIMLNIIADLQNRLSTNCLKIISIEIFDNIPINVKIMPKKFKFHNFITTDFVIIDPRGFEYPIATDCLKENFIKLSINNSVVNNSIQYKIPYSFNVV